jgi:hypothetical protein
VRGFIHLEPREQHARRTHLAPHILRLLESTSEHESRSKGEAEHRTSSTTSSTTSSATSRV